MLLNIKRIKNDELYKHHKNLNLLSITNLSQIKQHREGAVCFGKLLKKPICIKIIIDYNDQIPDFKKIIKLQVKASNAKLAVPIYKVFIMKAKDKFVSYIIMKKMHITLRQKLKMKKCDRKCRNT